ncbi:MAG: NfeD family protein, partial [Chloroflexota bacterium]
QNRHHADSGEGEAVGISLNVIAAFCVGVGSMGLVASLNDWSVLLTILTSLLFGLLMGRFFQVAFSYVLRQQHSGLIQDDALVGTIARVTVDTPAGKLGEALLEEPERMKYPIRHIDDTPLAKGDEVIVVKVEGGRLHVRKR